MTSQKTWEARRKRWAEYNKSKQETLAYARVLALDYKGASLESLSNLTQQDLMIQAADAKKRGII